MTVEEVVKRIDDLNGETVTVAGYLGRCFGYDCILYANEQEAEQTEAWFEELRAKAKRGERPSEMPGPAIGRYSLGVGSGEDFEFDRKAAPFQYEHVVVSGTITNKCRYKGEFGCADRTTDLRPTSIRSWNPPS